MKIDVFCHIMPDRYRKELFRIAPSGFDLEKMIHAVPTLTDLSERFRMMDQYPGLMQIPTLSAPAIESIAGPEEAVELAKIGNDEMAELVEKYPDRFPGAVASLPMNNIDAAFLEIERAINDLKLKGIQLFTPIDGESMEQEKFFPVYEKMAGFDLPIWIHPRRDRNIPDYSNESQSRFSIHSLLGWPYETSVAMVRLVMSGILERLPNLKIIAHHCGGMIPYFSDRLALSYSFKGPLSIDKLKERGIISKDPVEYLKMFYGDTALHGSTSALMCGHSFFGTENILFATDMPFDPEHGNLMIRKTIQGIENMTIPETDREKIFSGNIIRLLNMESKII